MFYRSVGKPPDHDNPPAEVQHLASHLQPPMKNIPGLRTPMVLMASAVIALSHSTSDAGENDQLGNWFDDPFLQVRSAVPDCPEPLGPRLTRQQATAQEHYRVERGTSCYLAGECAKPNAYLYDAPIAAAIQKLFDADASLARSSSLWITVTRRFVYLEGCRGSPGDVDKAEALIRAVPDVQLVLVNVAADPRGHLPYKRLKAQTE